MKNYLLQIGIEYAILIGAVVGAILALKKSKEKWLPKTTSFFTGVLGAVYLTPLVCSLISVEQDNLKTGIAVIIGYGGINFVDVLLKLLIKKLNNGNTE